ncbi:hypothetical protein I350_01373 [Cryptococcus amylolentus CBS 6273]|uniref:Zn(2)-C6 fungal-type domain-containing protein n=1 Tax=Cryptococcus amylolentus CBS 6273 TaxID=1296118 RepID=A0A1E3KCM4_9TREE|nr:hypothetical protein I350_01373 [Cryptococcus amylolentus CBS 6273]
MNGNRSTSAGVSRQGSINNSLAEAEAKKRKIQRACDVCRRKKIKCEGPMQSGSSEKCAHCEEFSLACTYNEQAKRRGPPKGQAKKCDACACRQVVLRALRPAVDFNEYVGPVPDRDDFDIVAYRETLRQQNIPPYPSLKPLQFEHRKESNGSASTSNTHSASPAAGAASPSNQVLGHSPWKLYERNPSRPPDDDSDVEEEAAAQLSIANSMNQLEVRDAHWRYHGKASGAHLMRQFQDLKGQMGDDSNLIDEINQIKRLQFWQVPEWELVIANEGLHPLDYSTWPEKGLDQDLIDAYFDHINLHLPLLNRPFFQRQYDSGMWQSNHGFSRVCLMVFANGSRFLDGEFFVYIHESSTDTGIDPRVYWPKEWSMTEEGQSRLAQDLDGTLRYSAGWRFMRSLLRMGRSIMQGPNLFEFQTQVLICNFLQGSAVPHLMWIISGFGLRSAQELGIHVRATLLHADPIERALYNRAFWCLYHIDRYNCAAIGRSVAIQDTDFDADYPQDVDDEYWDTGDPEKDFKQPEGKPSRIAAFIQLLKLDHIVGAVLQTVYAINKLPEQKADIAAQRALVVELDSALNSWADNVPHELRWDPSRQDPTLFLQSAVLYVYHYYCQILIHRPFIPTPRNHRTSDLPSLAVCVNAARSICNITDAALRRGRQEGALPGRALNVSFMLPSWISAIILLINIYSGKQTTSERERAVSDIKRCLAASRELEVIWRQSGKYTDFLTQLANESGMPTADKVNVSEKRTYSRGESEPTRKEGTGKAGFTSRESFAGDVVSPQETIRSYVDKSMPAPPTPSSEPSENRNYGLFEMSGMLSNPPASNMPFPSGSQNFTGHMSTPVSNTPDFDAIFQSPSEASVFPMPSQTHPPPPPVHQSQSQSGFKAPFPPSQSNMPSFPSFPAPSVPHSYQQSSIPQGQGTHPLPNLGHMPNLGDGQGAQNQFYGSLMGMNSFESQLLDMSTTAFGGQEMGAGDGDWWAQLFSDYMGPPPDAQNQNFQNQSLNQSSHWNAVHRGD